MISGYHPANYWGNSVMHIDEVHAYQRKKDDLMRNSYKNFRGDNMPIYEDQGEDSQMPRRKQAEYGNSHELLYKV